MRSLPASGVTGMLRKPTLFPHVPILFKARASSAPVFSAAEQLVEHSLLNQQKQRTKQAGKEANDESLLASEMGKMGKEWKKKRFVTFEQN